MRISLLLLRWWWRGEEEEEWLCCYSGRKMDVPWQSQPTLTNPHGFPRRRTTSTAFVLARSWRESPNQSVRNSYSHLFEPWAFLIHRKTLCCWLIWKGGLKLLSPGSEKHFCLYDRCFDFAHASNHSSNTQDEFITLLRYLISISDASSLRHVYNYKLYLYKEHEIQYI